MMPRAAASMRAMRQTRFRPRAGHRIPGRAAAKARGPGGAGVTSAAAGPPERRRPATNARSGGANERRRRVRAAQFGCRTSSFRAPSPRSRRSSARWRAPRVIRSHGRPDRPRGMPSPGSQNGSPRPRRSLRGVGSMSISSTSAPGNRAASAATRQPTTPAPITAMRSPGPGVASHIPLIAVSMLAASVARRSGTVSGTSTTASIGTMNRS